MLTQICRNLNNVFNIDSGDFGTYEIKATILNGSHAKYLLGSYIAIELRGGSSNNGSILNSGIYKITDDLITLENTMDEIWDGYIYQLAIPKGLIDLAEEIKINMKNTKQNNKKSENFGIYSYQKVTDKNGMVASWLQVYGNRLDEFRNRMFSEIRI